MERYADEIDRAAAISEQHNAACLEEAQRASRPEQVRNQDGTWPITECVDCGDEIPAGRLNMGKVRCIYCQELKERRSNGLV